MQTARLFRGLSLSGLWAVLLAAAATSSCSLLYDLNADQCTVDSDCRKFGSELPVCDAGICSARSTPGASGTAGTAGAGGESDPGTGAGGEGGASAPAECATNGECIDRNFGQPYVCQAGKCIALLTKECPQVVGDQNLRAPAPLVFGAYAKATDEISRSTVTRNLDLVVSEFTNKVTGLRGGPNGSRRTLTFVVCNSFFPDAAPGSIEAFTPSLEHLVDTLHVPGILAALQPKDLQAVFTQKLDAAGTFVISPYDQDGELATLADGGRLWHMLGATSDLAPAFGPLLKRTETYLRINEEFLKLPKPGAPLRVAIVTANVAQQTDVRDALVQLPELADFDVQQFQIDSALVSSKPDVSAVAGDLFGYKPNIIVALADSEFIETVFPLLETGNDWNTNTGGQARPFYVLGSTMAPETWYLYSSRQGDAGGYKSLMDRIVGVAYASAEDPTLREAYENRLKAANKDIKDPSVLLGSESAYDAGYLLIYAAAAAGQVPVLGGKDLATGMRRLVLGTPYDVGPTAIPQVLTALDNDDDVALNLTLGAANWNVGRGTRVGLGSAYCLNNGFSPLEKNSPPGPTPDALRYDPKTNALETKPLPCIPNF